MSANDDVREEVRITGLVISVGTRLEVAYGIDAADARQGVTQIVAGESSIPAQGMTSELLLKRVTERLKAGFRLHCVYKAGPTGFALERLLTSRGIL